MDWAPLVGLNTIASPRLSMKGLACMKQSMLWPSGRLCSEEMGWRCTRVSRSRWQLFAVNYGTYDVNDVTDQDVAVCLVKGYLPVTRCA